MCYPRRFLLTFFVFSERTLADALAAFLAIFIGVMILAGILGKVVRWLVKEAGLSFVDRFFGGVLGLIRGCLPGPSSSPAIRNCSVRW